MPATPTALTPVGPCRFTTETLYDEQTNDATNGNKFLNLPRTKLLVRNTTASAIILDFFVDLYGAEITVISVSIPGSGTEGGFKILGPFPSRRFDDHSTTASSTNGYVHCKARTGSDGGLMLCPYFEPLSLPTSTVFDLPATPTGMWTFDGLLLADNYVENVANPGVHRLTDLSYGAATPLTTGVVAGGIYAVAGGDQGPHVSTHADFEVASFGLMYWVRMATVAGVRLTLVRYDGSVGVKWVGFEHRFSNAGAVEVWVGNNVDLGDRSLICTSGNTVLADLAWHHVAHCYDTGVHRLYVDKVLVETDTKTIVWPTAGAGVDFRIFPDVPADTAMDELIFVSAAITAAHVTAAYDAGVAGDRVSFP